LGCAFDKDRFSTEDFGRFEEQLAGGLRALRSVLDRPGFGDGPPSLGAELEGSIVGRDGRPRFLNDEVLAGLDDPRTQAELVRFNLEYNLTPHPAAGPSFSRLEAKLVDAIQVLDGGCRRQGARFLPVGIVPTLREEDLRDDWLTPRPRYRALLEGLKALRGGPVELDIHGEAEALQTRTEAYVVEGSNTSYQLHLRIPPAEFADTYDAAQLVTPLALALQANSPIFFGKVLWDETRVPLFKQSFHARARAPVEWRRVARVPFGHGWVREGIWELFAESVALFPVVCPVSDEEDPEDIVASGGVPTLFPRRLHQGTIWQWNRAVYDPAGGGHVRVEMRALRS
jgi:hypothetical protein